MTTTSLVVILPTLHGPSWLVLGPTIYVADTGTAAGNQAAVRRAERSRK